MKPSRNGSVLDDLGVPRVVNACGAVTPLGGATLDPRVVQAMAEVSRVNVRMSELLAAIGGRIAGLLGVEAASVTCGSASGLALAVAACMTGEDGKAIRRLPNARGMKREVLMFAAQHNEYAKYVQQSGAKLVPIAKGGSLRRAIGDATAAFLYFPGVNEAEAPPLAQCAQACHRRGVSVIVDAAAKMPLPANVRRFLRDGADLIVYSGGKAIGGPQPSGILCGREDLVRAAALHTCPNHAIGRPMKVGREEAVGLLRALELFLQRDHQAEKRTWRRRLETIRRRLKSIAGVKVRLASKSHYGDPLPCLFVRPTDPHLPSAQEICLQLGQASDGAPAIEISAVGGDILVWPTLLQKGDERIIARRMTELLSST